MQIEKQKGFCGSYNFIPEGDYKLTREVREEMEKNGFEIGVHDLQHDGKLYESQEEFENKAAHINRYLREWGAGGFRSGFMLHNIEWAHALDVKYDASTFDTDPMEPQPDGVGTIFPYWVSGGENRGYVELPYTLPQDSTCFNLLQEKDNSIWKEKLDWIVNKGGMVLMDVHPDYVGFEKGRLKNSEYPAELYTEFLDHVNRKYAGQFWNPLPREMADWYNDWRLKTAPANITVTTNPFHDDAKPADDCGLPKPRFLTSAVPVAKDPPKRICMITHSIYETDNRVSRYANALAERGDEVDVLALKRDASAADVEMVGKVRVHRLQVRSRKDQNQKSAYLFPILRFQALATWWLTMRQLGNGYDVIHVHNVPDFLVFSAWLPRLMGAKVILDIHDMVPEFFASKFKSGDKSFAVSALKWMERVSAKFANHVIISNHLWHKVYTGRSVHEGNCSIFINWVDSKLFHPRGRSDNKGKFIISFPGGLQWHQGLDIAIRAMDKLRDRLPNAEFHIYGDGNAKPELVALVKELKLETKVLFFDPVPASQIAKVMSDADLGVVPKRADSFGNEAYSTKIMEFMSVGVPTVVSSTKIDRFYFNDSVVRFFESGNVDALAEAIHDVATNNELRCSLIARGSEYAAQNCWEVRKADYLQLVDSLCSVTSN
jgi:glycosyltransferase involved in cell wall biosynthesis